MIDLMTRLSDLPKLISSDGQDYVQLSDVLETVKIYSERLESLESEYNAYHTNRDYWRGIKYAIDVMRRR